MRKSLFGKESNYIDWLWNERYQISITLFAALLPIVATLFIKIWEGEFRNGGYITIFHNFFSQHNSLFQAVFVLVALFILIHNMYRTDDVLSKNKDLIANYIERNTNRRIRRCDEKYFCFEVVSSVARQFYVLWIIVWALWFVYYACDYFLFFFDYSPEDMEVQIFRNVFDFLSTIAMYGIYLVLTCFTTKIGMRDKNNYSLLRHLVFVIVLVVIWLSLLIGMNSWYYSMSIIASKYCSLYISAISAMAFVLVLGKLNSSYLQIPGVLLLTMYVYAVIQSYVPFMECSGELRYIGKIIKNVMPYATLIGKLAVMLTLCWIVDKKRLVFFIIHKSAAMEESPILLDELDNQAVEF